MSFEAASLRAALVRHAPAEVSGLVVALSGGADSAALLMAAAALQEFRGTLRAVHIDHGLQSAAGQFREACRGLCDALHVPLLIIEVRVDSSSGASIEAAARDARYAALGTQLLPKECLLTAHHRRDQAETLLLQALRGAGVKGLAAMPICRRLGVGWHLRPLLDVSQDELLLYAKSVIRHEAQLFAVATIADPMNDDLRFDRNYLRRQVWPLIEQRWPAAATALSRSARHAAEAQTLLNGAAASDLARLRDGDALSVPGLRALSVARRVNAVRAWLSESGREVPATPRINEALRQVFDADDDHLPAIVWGDSALRRYRQRLFFADAAPPRLFDTQAWAMPLSPLDLGAGLGVLGWAAGQKGGIGAHALSRGLTVRRRAGGEALKPGPRASTQSVRHLCQAVGVLPWMRDALPLVFAGDALIAVGDLWTDARWCVAADAPGLSLTWRDAPVIV